MVKKVARFLVMVFLVAQMLVSIVPFSSVASTGGVDRVSVVYFRDSVVYDSRDLGVCGVNYVVNQRFMLTDFMHPHMRVLHAGSPSVLAKAIGLLNSSLEAVLRENNITSRVFTGSQPVGGGSVPFAIISVPSSVNTGLVSKLLGQAAGRVEKQIGADVVVVLQVLPDDLFRPVNLSDLRESVKAVRAALFNAMEVASGDKTPGSREVAMLADALKRLRGDNGDISEVRIGWPEPEFGDPLYVNVDIAVTNASTIDKEAVGNLVKAIRNIIGCNYPLVIGIANSPIAEPDVLPVNNTANAQGKNTMTRKATGGDNSPKPEATGTTSAVTTPTTPSQLEPRQKDNWKLPGAIIVLLLTTLILWKSKEYSTRPS